MAGTLYPSEARAENAAQRARAARAPRHGERRAGAERPPGRGDRRAPPVIGDESRRSDEGAAAVGGRPLGDSRLAGGAHAAPVSPLATATASIASSA